MLHQVAVCGPRSGTPAEERDAYRVGQLLADRGAVVLCGGGRGVMAAVAAGARSHDGLVIGIRPDDRPETASPDLSVTIMTNLGEARNAVIAWSADAMIVVGGSWGTLSELALAMRRGGVPVISLHGWTILDQEGRPLAGIEFAENPEEAVDRAMAAIAARSAAPSRSAADSRDSRGTESQRAVHDPHFLAAPPRRQAS